MSKKTPWSFFRGNGVAQGHMYACANRASESLVLSGARTGAIAGMGAAVGALVGTDVTGLGIDVNAETAMFAAGGATVVAMPSVVGDNIENATARKTGKYMHYSDQRALTMHFKKAGNFQSNA